MLNWKQREKSKGSKDLDSHDTSQKAARLGGRHAHEYHDGDSELDLQAGDGSGIDSESETETEDGRVVEVESEKQSARRAVMQRPQSRSRPVRISTPCFTSSVSLLIHFRSARQGAQVLRVICTNRHRPKEAEKKYVLFLFMTQVSDSRPPH